MGENKQFNLSEKFFMREETGMTLITSNSVREFIKLLKEELCDMECDQINTEGCF